MATEITINEDQTLTVRWTGRKGYGSLFQTMAEGNAAYVNELTLDELLAVLVCVKGAPFPLGRGEQYYRKALETVVNTPENLWDEGKPTHIKLGELRAALVNKAGSGCNAPTDSYLRIAYQIKKGEHVERY